jgi:hypothetical protein
MDLQIAATVFVHGYDLLSVHAHHSLIAAGWERSRRVLPG